MALNERIDMKNYRLVSFLVVFVTYVSAILIGTVSFLYMTFLPVIWNLLIADLIATAVVFAMSIVTSNASMYDPYWSVAPLAMTPLLMVFTKSYDINSILLLVFLEIWAIRLTANWAYLFKGLDHQDWRYMTLREQSGRLYPLVNLFGIHYIPTLVVFSCLVPLIELYADSSMTEFKPMSLIGGLVMLICTALELIADMQRHRFREGGNKGVVNVGLWKHGRHPNYLGEIGFWYGLYAFVVAVDPSLWWTFFGCVINTLLFLFASIPMAEKNSAKRHGQEWEEYKKESRLFI